MDNKINKKITFELIKNIIIQQNKLLLKEVAKKTNINQNYLDKHYIKPEYYLPIIMKNQNLK